MEILERPEVDSPSVLVAFQGWNDAGQAATTALRYLIESWKAQKFARIDPEEYFSFTDTRPNVRIVDGTQRELVWPHNDFYAFSGNTNNPPMIMMLGMEPNLRWRSFCSEIIDLARSLNAQRIVTLGSLITDAVHTRPVPLTGFAADAPVAEKLAARSITRSSYEGPTGIAGTLHNVCLHAGMPAASIWAATPYYLGATPNPKAAYALLEALDDALGLKINLGELKVVAREFERQVTAAVKDDSDMQERIRTLEENYDQRGVTETPPAAPGTPPEFPETGVIIADLEDFLRTKREGE
jgi:proteasome assembly chaperone (PAC2) family protein